MVFRASLGYYISIINTPFGSSLASSNIKAINAYGWGVQFKKGSLQNFLVKYLGVFHLGTRIRNRILSKIFNQSNLTDKVMLDAGCGIGLASIYYSPLFKKVIGVDEDRLKINQAKSLSKDNLVKNVDFRVADLTSGPFTNKRFDRIICFEVIEHVYDDKKLLTGLSRLLKNNGELILSFPSKTLMSKIAQKSLDHFKVGYVPSDIKKILKTLNMKVVEEYSFGKSILGKTVVFIDFLMRKSIPIVASAFFPVFYPLMLVDYYLPKFGIPRGYVLVIKRK